MKVVDSSVIVDVLVGRLDFERVGDEPLVAPHLMDSEVLHALRGLELGRQIAPATSLRAMRIFTAMEIGRYGAAGLHERIWELRHNLTAYDATYAALAEALDVTSLLTRDGPLARAPGIRCHIEVL